MAALLPGHDLPTNIVLPKVKEFRRLEVFKPLKTRQIRFLAALIQSNLVVTRAAKSLGIDWRAHYNWLARDSYKQAYEYVREMVADLLESTMLDDAVVGRTTDIVYQGKVTGSYRNTFPQERIALLKGMRPQYRDNWQINNFAGPSQLNLGYTSPPPAIDVTPPKDNESK